MKTSELEVKFAIQLAEHRVPAHEAEYLFAKDIGRKWRFDFAWPAVRVAVEIEGATWAKSRHTTGAGFKADCEKYNAAVMLGWRVLRFTGDSVIDESGAGITAKLVAKMEEIRA